MRLQVQAVRQAQLHALETPEESQHHNLLDAEQHAISCDIVLKNCTLNEIAG